MRVRPARRDYLDTEMRPEERLLVEWPKGEAEPTKYFLSTTPTWATPEQLVFVAKMRWHIERDYQHDMCRNRACWHCWVPDALESVLRGVFAESVLPSTQAYMKRLKDS